MYRTVFCAAAAVAMISSGGCGDDAHQQADAAIDAATTDAAPADAPVDADLSPDAEPDAAPPGQVWITILDGQDQGVANIDIVFSNADGSLISHKETDGDGVATDDVPGRGFVSVVVGGGGNHTIWTVGDIQPGDEIVIRNFGAEQGGGPGPELAGTASLTWPGSQEGAVLYRASEGCEGVETDAPETPSSLPVSEGCLVDGAFLVVAQAVAEGNFDTEVALAHSVAVDQQLDEGSANVTLPAWSTDFQEVPVNLSNPPTNALAFLGDTSFFLGSRELDIADDVVMLSPGNYAGKVPAGITPDAVLAQTVAAYGTFQTISGVSVLASNAVGLPASIEQDLAAQMPRSATNGVFDASDPARPIVDWTATKNAGAANLTQVRLVWTEDADVYSWTLVTAPSEAGPVQLPELPEALASFAPNSGSDYQSVQMVYFAASWITEDWPTLRQLGGISASPQPATGWSNGISLPFFPTLGKAPSLPAARTQVKGAARALR